MSESKVRIETLRKEKTKENYDNSGISTLLIEDFKITLPKDYTKMHDYQIAENVYSSVLRQMTKKVESEIKTYEDLAAFAEMISFGSYKVNIEPLYETDETEHFKDYMVTLLKSCAKVKGMFNHDVVEKFLPAKVTYTSRVHNGEFHTNTAHTFGNSKMPKRIHERTWAMTNQKKYKYTLIVDIAKIFTRAFLNNTVESFLIKNQELYHYKFALEFLNFSSNRSHKETGVVYVPEELDSRILLLNTFKKYDLVDKSIKLEPKEGYDRYGINILLGYNPETNSVMNFNSNMYNLMLNELISKTIYIKDKVDRAVRETSDYARSFQTKKHINQKTQEAMESNAFLSRYGYVELDNEVELKKFELLQNEFKELAQKIYIPVAKDHSFRIKKLGKHRAAGLYYPAPVRATIFDLDYPTAYCHELGHQIDYTLLNKGEGMVSETVRFMRIIELYKETVNETINNLSDGDAFKEAWKGKSKYNASYYFLPTEIFARSFEMYLTNKGIKTSFLPEHLGTPVYPMKNELLLSTITTYFDELFAPYIADMEKEPTLEKTEVIEDPTIEVQQTEQSDEETNKKIPAAAPRSSGKAEKKTKDKQKVEEDNWDPSNFEQLSLF